MDNEIHRAKFRTYLHVHHVSYARLGVELDSDLEALCKRCHNAEESSEFDPTEYGDPLAIELGVGRSTRRSRIPLSADGSEVDLSIPSEEYWTKVLLRIERRIRQVATVKEPNENVWRELSRLDGLEAYARRCLELESPEYVLERVLLEDD